ncbi:hypothetical protein [Weissella sagaensis]|uniref:hypothetical protein n=1 Tax=Weissella sagaensis TaxID=2559928 RepID=UPI001EFF4F62|nr:hypothetical protein [Weissella sagaensis]
MNQAYNRKAVRKKNKATGQKIFAQRFMGKHWFNGSLDDNHVYHIHLFLSD